MNLKDIVVLAKQKGIKPGKLNKAQLIKTIQLDEGNFDCYATAYVGECDQHDCMWRKDCLKASQNKVH